MPQTDNTDDPPNGGDTSATEGIPASKEKSPNDVERPSLPRLQVNLLGIFLIAISAMIVYLIYSFWPDTSEQTEQNKWDSACYLFCVSNCKGENQADDCVCINLPAEQRILVLVLLGGALGSCIHAVSSFTNYVGEGKIERSWIWWYILRPFIGTGLAFAFYLIFRGGLLNDTNVEGLNIYGILSLSVLAGLFTDRATLKLEEVFEALFRPKDNRTDKLTEKKDAIEENKGAEG